MRSPFSFDTIQFRSVYILKLTTYNWKIPGCLPGGGVTWVSKIWAGAFQIAKSTTLKSGEISEKYIHGSCGHNLGVDQVHNTWLRWYLINKCISLHCLSSCHYLSSRSCLGAHQHAINGSAWPKFFELHCDLKKPWPKNQFPDRCSLLTTHPVNENILNESLEGRVHLGTSSQVMAFKSQCSSKNLGHAEPLMACWCAPRQELKDK